MATRRRYGVIFSGIQVFFCYVKHEPSGYTARFAVAPGGYRLAEYVLLLDAEAYQK